MNGAGWEMTDSNGSQLDLNLQCCGNIVVVDKDAQNPTIFSCTVTSEN